jgi:hypothetical protein
VIVPFVFVLPIFRHVPRTLAASYTGNAEPHAGGGAAGVVELGQDVVAAALNGALFDRGCGRV